METNDSLPCSQGLALIFLSHMNPVYILSYSCKMHLNIHLSLKVDSCLQICWLKFCSIPLNSHACYMTQPSHPPFHHPNKIRWWAQIKLLVQILSTLLCSLRPKNYSQHTILEHSESMIFLQSKRPSFTKVKL
jgi:hypothetical protein